MKKFLFVFVALIYNLSFSQTFEITNGTSMCMIGKGKGQDATINPYADKEYSYALIENIGTVKFEVRIEKPQKNIKSYTINPKNSTVIKLYKNDILYFDALTQEKAEATIKYIIDENDLPPPPPPKKI